MDYMNDLNDYMTKAYKRFKFVALLRLQVVNIGS